MSVALGQFYFGDLHRKWVSFQSALTHPLGGGSCAFEIPHGFSHYGTTTMPRSILTAATSATTVPRRHTLRLSQADWDRLDAIERRAKDAGMALDTDGALADFLLRQIASAERKLANQLPEPTTDAASPEDDAASSGWPDHG